MTLRNLIAGVALLALSVPAFADGLQVKDATGATITKKTKTISGQESDQPNLVDQTGTDVLGAVTANPAANTVLDRLKTIATNTAGGGGSVSISQTTPGTTNGVVVNSGTVNVGNVSGTVALPTGASTSAAQTTGNNSLSSIDTKLSSQATAANQTTGNSSLSTIATQTNLAKSSTNVLDSPKTGACDGSGTNACKETHTNLTADSGGTTICPATANVIATMIYFTTADVGVSLSGSTGMNSRTVNATSLTTSPSFNIATAGSLWTAPIGFTSGITANGAAGYISCIQFIRQ
jgi:hypothetical protein